MLQIKNIKKVFNFCIILGSELKTGTNNPSGDVLVPYEGPDKNTDKPRKKKCSKCYSEWNPFENCKEKSSSTK